MPREGFGAGEKLEETEQKENWTISAGANEANEANEDSNKTWLQSVTKPYTLQGRRSPLSSLVRAYEKPSHAW